MDCFFGIQMQNNLRKNKALKILEILEQNNYAAMIAGGAVRDQLLGLSPSDFDIATTARPEQVQKVFEDLGTQVIPTGLAHGTVTIIYQRTSFEITTTRQDKYTDGRHAEVQFSQSFEEDAKRRDFTVNALFEDRFGQIFDYVKGKQDLANRVLKFVGDAESRVHEDYLRILRLYRFWGQLDLTPDESARNAAVRNRANIGHLSQERKTSELLKTFSRTKSSDVYEAMISDKILAELIYFPDRTFEHWVLENKNFIHSYHSTSKDIFLLSQFYDHPENFGLQADRYCISNAQSKAGQCFLNSEILGAQNSDTSHLMDCIDRIEKDLGENGFMKTYLPIMRIKFAGDQTALEKLYRLEQCETQLSSRRREKMPINGTHLKDRFGFTDGPELGKILIDLKTQFRNGIWNSRAEAFHLVSTWLTLPD